MITREQRKKRKLKKKFKLFLLIMIFLIILIISGYFIVQWLIDNNKVDKLTNEITNQTNVEEVI